MMKEPATAIADIVSDKAESVWFYEFAQPTEMLGGLLGACHSLDLAYVFGTVDRIPLTGRNYQRLDVSQKMMRAWASFARNGRPDDGAGDWEPWTRQRHVIHQFGTPHGPALELPPHLDMAEPDEATLNELL